MHWAAILFLLHLFVLCSEFVSSIVWLQELAFLEEERSRNRKVVYITRDMMMKFKFRIKWFGNFSISLTHFFIFITYSN